MKHRKLRIAWSVAWSVVAVLLCVLWARSNQYIDAYWIALPNHRALAFVSGANVASIGFQRRNPLETTYTVGFASDEWKEPAFQIASAEKKLFRGFFTSRNSDTIYLNVPYWFLVLLAAAIPWLPWPSRFSLRTLLIAMTVVAVLLGLIVWMSRAG